MIALYKLITTEKMFSWFCAYLSAAVACGQSGFRCSPGALGFFRDTTDCTVFYRCTGDGQTHRFSCPAGLVFDSRSGTCNWKNQVPECGGRNTIQQVNNVGTGQSRYSGQEPRRNYQGQQGTGRQSLPNQNNVRHSTYGNQGSKSSGESRQKGPTYQDTLREMLINMPAISFPPDVLKPSFSTLSNTLGAGNTITAHQTQRGSSSISTNGPDNIITIFNPITNKAEPFLVREIDPSLISPHLVNRFLSRVQPQGNAMFSHLPLKQNIHPFLKFQKPHLVHNNAGHDFNHHQHRRQFNQPNMLPNVFPPNNLPNINRPFLPVNPLQSLGTVSQQQYMPSFLSLPQGASQYSVNDILSQVLYPQMLNMQQINPFAQPPTFPFLPQLPQLPTIPINNETLEVLSLLYNLTAGSQGALDPVLQLLFGPLLLGNPGLTTTTTNVTPTASNKVTINTSGTVTLNVAALSLDHLQCTKVHHVLNTVLSSLVKSLYNSAQACNNACVVNIPAIAVTC